MSCFSNKVYNLGKTLHWLNFQTFLSTDVSNKMLFYSMPRSNNCKVKSWKLRKQQWKLLRINPKSTKNYATSFNYIFHTIFSQLSLIGKNILQTSIKTFSSSDGRKIGKSFLFAMPYQHIFSFKRVSEKFLVGKKLEIWFCKAHMGWLKSFEKIETFSYAHKGNLKNSSSIETIVKL